MRKMLKTIELFWMLTLLLSAHAFAYANEEKINPETGYKMLIMDTADLLGEDEAVIDAVMEQMERVSDYGHAALLTVDVNSDGVSDLAKKAYRDSFQKESGCLFLIDMDNRQLYFFCDGAVYKTISKSVALTISDNVYRYASEGDYVACVREAFAQVADKLEGRKIAAPMRYLSAFFLAILLALVISFTAAKLNSTADMAKEEKLMEGLLVEQKLQGARRILVKREMHMASSDSGGSSGGGGGGGGSSGGGGGHGF